MQAANAGNHREKFSLMEFPEFMEKYCPDLMTELERKYWNDIGKSPSQILEHWNDKNQSEREKYWLLGWVTTGVERLCGDIPFNYLLFYANATAKKRIYRSVPAILSETTEINREAFREGCEDIL